MTVETYWAVAQTVSKMEHIARRDIEKADHGAFLPTFAKHWKVDGRDYAKEYPLFTGYVFFLTRADDWAGIPDIHGVYRVLAAPDCRGRLKPMLVSDVEMKRLVIEHAAGDHDRAEPERFTRYYRPPTKKAVRYRRRRPRPGKRLRNLHNTQPEANQSCVAQR